ncbi:hypothetical protein, partial [Gimesia maris]|uniref:hypothetical protein n=1 Tax=Gimesia maris TaxID=122 RepID=UPI00241F49A6
LEAKKQHAESNRLSITRNRLIFNHLVQRCLKATRGKSATCRVKALKNELKIGIGGPGSEKRSSPDNGILI